MVRQRARSDRVPAAGVRSCAQSMAPELVLARQLARLRDRDIVEDVESRRTAYLDLRRLDLLGLGRAALPCPARMMVLAVLLTASRSAVSAMCEYRWVVR
jgi:hypothetical protein